MMRVGTSEWFVTAEQRRKAADALAAEGRTISARQEYLRAANYYRTAEFFLHSNPGDPRILATWRQGRESFLRAAKLSRTPIVPVEIPFEGTTLPGLSMPRGRSEGKATAPHHPDRL
jgi:hypothetical protein